MPSGSRSAVPVAASKRGRVSLTRGSAMLEERTLERRSMPGGMFSFQNAIGLPNTLTSTPASARCAATASP